MRSLSKLTKVSGLNAIYSLIKIQPTIIRTNDEINPQYLLMTPDLGSIDPLSGEVITKPGAVFNRCTGVTPDIGGHVPTEFYKFLHAIFEINDPDKTENENFEAAQSVIDRLLDTFAIALSGRAGDIEIIISFSGQGGTGKQQLLELLERIAGSYFTWMRPDSLYESNTGGDTPRSDLLRIVYSLFIAISEPSDQKISASLFKTLGSCEPIPCRPHHSKQVIEVRSRGLVLIASNRKPYLIHDEGTKRRLECYEFQHKFSESDERITDIGKKIAALEGPQILNDLIKRAGAWKARGGEKQHISQSDTVKRWTTQYITWSDTIGRFLDDETEAIPGELASVSEVQRRFVFWADKLGENRMSSRALGEALAERGVKKIKKETGWKFTGIRLKPNAEAERADYGIG
jgi:phage/plasmid-associated DNA primase